MKIPSPLDKEGLQGGFGKGNTQPTSALRDHRRFGEGFSSLHPLLWRGFSEETQREAELGHSAIIPGKANSTRSGGLPEHALKPGRHHVAAGMAGGDSQALERLVPLVRTEIHRLAGRYMKRERPDMSYRRPLWSMKPTCG